MSEWFDRVVRRAQTWRFFDHVYRVRWIAAGFAILLMVAIPWGLRSEERGLESATRAALSDVGIVSADVSFSGRTGTVVAAMDQRQQRAARAAIASVDGIRGITFVLLANPAPARTTTTSPPSTTTTLPPGPFTHVLATLDGDGLSLEGTLPDARATADITRMAELFYRDDLTNTLTVDPSLPTTAWNDAAAGTIAVLPMLSSGTIALDESGVTVVGVVVSVEIAEAATKRLQQVLGADVPIDSTFEVSDGDLPVLSMTTTKGAAQLSGVLPSAELRASIRQIVNDNTSDVDDALTVGLETLATYPTSRTPYLLGKLMRAKDSSLRLAGAETRGSMVDGSVWRRDSSKITRATEGVLETLAAMMAGDPALHLTIEIHSSSAGGRSANIALTDLRIEAVQAFLFRAGADPDRLVVTTGNGSGELLRFLAAPADQDD